MFNKKRKAAEKQQRLEARAEKERAFADDIAAAEEIADPAERILKLAALRNEILHYIEEQRRAPLFYNSTKVMSGGALSGAAMVAGGVALIPVAPHVSVGMMIAAYSTIYGSVIGNGVSNNRKQRKLFAEVKGHLVKMQTLEAQTAKMKDALVRERAEEILDSPFYEQVLKLPGLSEAFAGAAAKQAAKLKKELEKERAAKEAAQKALRGEKPTENKLQRYDKLKGVMNPKKK